MRIILVVMALLLITGIAMKSASADNQTSLQRYDGERPLSPNSEKLLIEDVYVNIERWDIKQVNDALQGKDVNRDNLIQYPKEFTDTLVGGNASYNLRISNYDTVEKPMFIVFQALDKEGLTVIFESLETVLPAEQTTSVSTGFLPPVNSGLYTLQIFLFKDVNWTALYDDGQITMLYYVGNMFTKPWLSCHNNPNACINAVGGRFYIPDPRWEGNMWGWESIEKDNKRDFVWLGGDASQDQSKLMLYAVNYNQSPIRLGETFVIKCDAIDYYDGPMAGAMITGSIRGPDNAILAEFGGVTDSSGRIVYEWYISPSLSPGIYSITVSMSADGYKPKDGVTLFQVVA
jgi:hypothetical protein